MAKLYDKFPDTIYVVVDINSDAKSPGLIAERTVEEAVADDRPTVIADYKLVRTRKFRKEAVEVK